MGNGLLRRQLSQLVEQEVKLELGREVRQPSVAERLQRPVRDEGAHQVHVCDVDIQVGVLVGDGVTGNDVIFGSEDVVDPVDGF